jgi:uncharacterized protein DUF1707
VALVSAREREVATEALRRHFLGGRLSLDEFADRVRLALQARDGRDLQRSLRGLPPVWRDGDELRRLARSAKRRALVATVSALWLLVTLILLVAFAAQAVVHGATIADLAGYLTVWAIVSALAWRARRRA